MKELPTGGLWCCAYGLILLGANIRFDYPNTPLFIERLLLALGFAILGFVFGRNLR